MPFLSPRRPFRERHPRFPRVANLDFEAPAREFLRFIEDFVGGFEDEDFMIPSNRQLRKMMRKQNRLLREGGANETEALAFGNTTVSLRRPEFEWKDTDEGFVMTGMGEWRQGGWGSQFSCLSRP